MSLFQRVRIKTRILILIAIPICAISIFVLDRYHSANTQLEIAKQLNILHQYIEKLSSLSLSLKQERLYSKFHLDLNSHNIAIAPEVQNGLKSSRVSTDDALDDYLSFVSDEKALSAFPTLLSDIDDITAHLVQLPKYRSQVDQKLKFVISEKSPGMKIWTYAYYKKVVQLLNGSTKQIVLIASGNKELSLLTNAYQNATYAHDVAMKQISAIFLSIIFKISANTFGDIMENRALESDYLQKFENFSPKHTKDFFKANLAGQKSYRFANKEYDNIRKNIKSLIGTQLKITSEEWMKVGVDINRGYNQLIEHILSELARTNDLSIRQAKSKLQNTSLSLAALLLTLLIVSLNIVSSINTPLKYLIDDISLLADTKDMTIRNRLEGKNELTQVGQAFNSLTSAFSSTLSKVRSKIISMDGTTANVSNLMNESILLIDSQRDSMDSISVAINQMTATFHEVSKMTVATSDAATRAYDLSISSENDGIASKMSMSALNEELGDTSKLVDSLNVETSQISSILQVIRGISDQTNLLALNAAIEAARAGDMGRGFAVVADEVRELSRRTHESTEQIQGQIETLVEVAAASSKKMELLQLNSTEAIKVVSKGSDAIISIKSELDRVSNMAHQIAVASEQQSNVVEDINKRIHQIKDASEILVDQGSKTLQSTQTLLEDGADLKADIEVFHF